MTPSPLVIDQETSGYRYTQDSFILADFFRPAQGTQNVADFCAGAGVVSLLIARRAPSLKITALEINHTLARRAMDNAKRSGLTNYNVVTGDVMSVPYLFRESSFDALVCNPPYKKRGSGRLNPDFNKAIARHEVTMTLQGLIRASAWALKKGGELYIIMLSERRNEYRDALKENRFCEARFRQIILRPGQPPRLFISSARLGVSTQLVTEPALEIPPHGIRENNGN